MKKILAATLILLAFTAETSMAKDKKTVQFVPLQVTEKGFEPEKISVKPGTHVV